MEKFQLPWSFAGVLRRCANSSRVPVSYRRRSSAARTVRFAFSVVLAPSVWSEIYREGAKSAK